MQDLIDNLKKQQAIALTNQMELITKLHLMGVNLDQIKLYRAIALELAATTRFSNEYVVETIMNLLYERACQELPVVPDDVQIWAEEFWNRTTADSFLRSRNLSTLAEMRPEQKALWDRVAAEFWAQFKQKK